ncbi:unnamed protein product [Soboliphyme baturini]|uniref:Integrase_H2C2 domain-containing protein n=1 Tax=Soboliphyme baturini TaxID=241478 RepID=A0A183J8X5_9BILA|nr:unnamed protein product [Soboliphyme baturini]
MVSAGALEDEQLACVGRRPRCSAGSEAELKGKTEAMQRVSELRHSFTQQLSLIESGKDLRSSFLTRSKYESLVADLKRIRHEGKYRRIDYNRQRRFQLDYVDGKDVLVDPRKGLMYVVDDQLFDVFHDTHMRLGHVGRYAMLKHLRKQYVNINKKALCYYLSMCEQCHGGSGNGKPNMAVETMLSPAVPSPPSLPPADPVPESPRSNRSFNGRGPGSTIATMSPSRHRGSGASLAIVNVVDFVRVGSDFRFIVIYQDKTSGFCMLRPAKAADEQVAHVLLAIMCTVGPPAVIRFHCSTKLDARITRTIRNTVPSIQVKCSKATGSRLPVGQLHLITSIQSKLDMWLQRNPGADWTTALKFVQLFVNTNFGRSTTKRRCEAIMRNMLSSKRATKELLCQLLPESEVKKTKRRGTKTKRPRPSQSPHHNKFDIKAHKRNLLDVIESLTLEKMRNAERLTLPDSCEVVVQFATFLSSAYSKQTCRSAL